jgi:hypothetical protein
MPPGLRWAWPAALAAAVGITISAAAQQATVTPVPPRESAHARGTEVTPELFAPNTLSGAPEFTPPVPPPSLATEPIMPPRLAPVPGSQPIIPAPLAPPVEGDVSTAKTDPAEKDAQKQEQPMLAREPAQVEQPNAEPASEPLPEMETPRPPPEKGQRARRQQPEALKTKVERRKTGRKKGTPSRAARQKREVETTRETRATKQERTSAGGLKPPMNIAPPAADQRSKPAPSPRQSPRAESALADPGASNQEINAAFRTLDRDEQRRVRARCAELLAAPRTAAADELRVCRAL